MQTAREKNHVYDLLLVFLLTEVVEEVLAKPSLAKQPQSKPEKMDTLLAKTPKRPKDGGAGPLLYPYKLTEGYESLKIGT